MRDAAQGDAPGRVNLMGEHTDYHGGYVLPTVISQRTQVRVRRRRDRRVTVYSTAYPGERGAYALGAESPGRGWLDYVQGVTAILREAGMSLCGFDAEIESTVPVGAGVSSSAALDVAALRALRVLLELALDDVDLAKVAQRVETDFVGAPVGIMDPMAVSLGRAEEALFLDTATLRIERVPLPPSIEILVIDSEIRHAHADGAYGTRRRESFEAAALLGVTSLSELDEAALPRIEQLPPVLARRARHVVTEHARVLAAVKAIRADDPKHLGALFAASHASMRDDYEITTPEIDTLVEIATDQPGVYGARLTGGGFGGAIVVIAEKGRGRSVADDIVAVYRRRMGGRARVLVPPQ